MLSSLAILELEGKVVSGHPNWLWTPVLNSIGQQGSGIETEVISHLERV